MVGQRLGAYCICTVCEWAEITMWKLSTVLHSKHWWKQCVFWRDGSSHIGNKGCRHTVNVQNCGSLSRCLIWLGVTLDGWQQVTGFYCLQGKTTRWSNFLWMEPFFQFPLHMYCYLQRCSTKNAHGEVGGVDKTIFGTWIKNVWRPFSYDKESTHTHTHTYIYIYIYLIMDEFSVHLMAECVNAVPGCSNEVDVILSGGYTSK